MYRLSSFALLLCCVLAASVRGLATPQPDELIARLAREAPAQTAFREARFSRLLREPVVVAGELRYLGSASLDRRITMPYDELTTVRGEAVTVERDGEARRTFTLERAPELRGLVSSFAGLLAGDSDAVKRDFSLAARGTDDAWVLELSPIDVGARRRLKSIVVTGSANEPRCMAILGPRDSATVMLLGAAAERPIEANATLPDLLAYCRAE